MVLKLVILSRCQIYLGLLYFQSFIEFIGMSDASGLDIFKDMIDTKLFETPDS